MDGYRIDGEARPQFSQPLAELLVAHGPPGKPCRQIRIWSIRAEESDRCCEYTRADTQRGAGQEGRDVSDLWSFIADNDSVTGKLATSAVIVAAATVLGVVAGRLLSRRVDDRYHKYHTRKIVHYVVVVVALIGLGILWRPFAGQLGLLLGLIAAGVVVALQGVISSVAGWFNIISGGIFRVGDRVQLGGVSGDVIDI